MTDVRNGEPVQESRAVLDGNDNRRKRRGESPVSVASGPESQSDPQWRGVVGNRLLNLESAASYLGLSYWTMRDMVQAGQVPTVRFPAPRANDGRVIRRILVDRTDLDRLVEKWKESSVN